MVRALVLLVCFELFPGGTFLCVTPSRVSTKYSPRHLRFSFFLHILRRYVCIEVLRVFRPTRLPPVVVFGASRAALEFLVCTIHTRSTVRLLVDFFHFISSHIIYILRVCDRFGGRAVYDYLG